MASRRTRARKLLNVLLYAVIAVVIVAVSCPVWFPWAVVPILSRLQIQVGNYHRVGASGLILEDVRYRKGAVQCDANRVEMLLPTSWIYRHYFNSRTRPAQDHITVSDWTLRLDASRTTNNASAAPDPMSTTQVLETIDTYLPQVRNWVPAASLTNGQVHVGAQIFALPFATWSHGILKGNIVRGGRSVDLVADVRSPSPYRLKFELAPYEIDTIIELQEATAGWELTGSVLWRSNRADLIALFDQHGPLPRRATITATNWLVAEVWGGYSSPTGSLVATWADDRFSIQFQAGAEPMAEGFLPPVEVDVEASGSMETVRLERLEARTPWLTMSLSNPVELTTRGRLLSDQSALRLDANLSAVPWGNLMGRVTGAVQVSPGLDGGYPGVEFDLTGTGLRVEDFEISGIRVAGDLAWPDLTIAELQVELPGASFSASGRLDWAAKEVFDVSWRAQGTMIPLLPEDYAFDQFAGDGTLSGDFVTPTHEGRVQFDGFEARGFKPVDIAAEWTGEGVAVSRARIAVTAEQSLVTVVGDGRFTQAPQPSLTVTLSTLQLEREGNASYQLRQPARLSLLFPAEGPEPAAPLSMHLDSLEWFDGESQLTISGDVAWPVRGALSASVQGMQARLLQDFLVAPIPAVVVDDFKLEAGWTNGPLVSRVMINSHLERSDNSTFTATGEFQTGETGLRIESANVSSSAGRIAEVEGTVPVMIHPGNATNFWTIKGGETIALRASTTTNEAFWNQVMEMSGARLVAPELELEINGTPANPQGSINARAELIEMRFLTNFAHIPAMERFSLLATVSQKAVSVEELTFEVEKQLVSFSGQLPLPDSFWPGLRETPNLPDWQQATGRLQIQDAALASVSDYLPSMVSPSGRLGLDLTIQPGPEFGGSLWITNASMQAVSELGAIREINAQIAFTGRTATIRQFAGMLGGSPILLSGTIKSPELTLPEFDLKLEGSRLPLVRKAGLLLRADLDLHVRTVTNSVDSGGSTDTPYSGVLITGNVVPMDSLFLQDLKSLMPGGLAQEERRPPYFRVEEPPLSDWRLDVRIKGDRFLRVRTPLFRGELSIDMSLRGPLRDPVSIGSIRIDQGTLLFPFCNMTVEQGLIDLTSENPYDPHLFVTASSRAFGYNLRMEASGLASDPALLFTSTPSLTSEEILLMITAGELPQNDVTFSKTQKASRLATVVGKDILTRITGSEDTAERLVIRSGENISEGGNLTYYLEYKLDDRWSVVGESDRFNALNAGIKWRLYSR